MPAGTVDESGALRMADSVSGNDGLSRTEATGVANVVGPEHSMGAGERYARQTLFFGIGGAGQERLGRARVLIVGCGATGSVLANNLARAGVGHLRLADRDYVEGNNLQRQVLYEEEDVLRGMPKAAAAAERLRHINSLVHVEPLGNDVTADNIEELLDGVDLALDGTDNFETRYLLNDACLKLRIPWIYCGVIAAHGVTMTILPGDSACLCCVFPERPLPGTTATCDTAGGPPPRRGGGAWRPAPPGPTRRGGRAPAVRGKSRVVLWVKNFAPTAVARPAARPPPCGRPQPL